MTTTDEKARRNDLTPLEGRLFLISALAIGYVVAWFGIAPRPAAPPPAPSPSPEAEPVWISELAPAAQPRVKVPKGWAIAPAPAARAPRRVVPPAAPRPRIRTRSS